MALLISYYDDPASFLLNLAAFALLHNTKGDLLCKLSTTSNDIHNILPKFTMITNDGNVIVQYVREDGGLIVRYSCNGQKLSTWSLKENSLVWYA